ncbi:MAG: GGDEF domain-containing protein, partial [Acidobacteria bacterium]|nr:GGDEF domain-containing protein [Acidobacteriota bacterium]
MTKEKPDPPMHSLNLSAAIRILTQAGRPDPTRNGGDFAAQLQALIDGLCDLSVKDGLTGLDNAISFRAELARELDRSSRTGRTCALLFLDIDHFKGINDSLGHLAGDTVLQVLARSMRRSLRSMDTAARIGGEEFAVILPECDAIDAVCAGARIHGLLNPFEVETENGVLRITTSAGLVWTEPYAAVTVEELMGA